MQQQWVQNNSSQIALTAFVLLCWFAWSFSSLQTCAQSVGYVSQVNLVPPGSVGFAANQGNNLFYYGSFPFK
ncbi:hypothetical protein RND71_003524 [Anisodus tanguticus]|uniref:Uncharacterized protein n=1 Tax=Anisodus tanguticus TaxID=243964 RepID=A0AAE1VNS6_9SOLA|nr:hypothetical protein RND71_003524 [Anisodus tanguticus]